MEREQIIKALECCTTLDGCEKCPYYNKASCGANLRRDALALIKELTEENERLKADSVREIFKEIYSSLDYIEEQMEPEEIPECFFSVREDINALKEKFESEGAADEI